MNYYPTEVFVDLGCVAKACTGKVVDLHVAAVRPLGTVKPTTPAAPAQRESYANKSNLCTKRDFTAAAAGFAVRIIDALVALGGDAATSEVRSCSSMFQGLSFPMRCRNPCRCCQNEWARTPLKPT